MSRLQIALRIAQEMDRYEIDGYWYGRHDSVISKVTVKNTSGNAIVDLAEEICRVGLRGFKTYPLVWNSEYGAEMYDETKPYSLVWDWKYRRAFTNWIKEERARRVDKLEADKDYEHHHDYVTGE